MGTAEGKRYCNFCKPLGEGYCSLESEIERVQRNGPKDSLRYLLENKQYADKCPQSVVLFSRIEEILGGNDSVRLEEIVPLDEPSEDSSTRVLLVPEKPSSPTEDVRIPEKPQPVETPMPPSKQVPPRESTSTRVPRRSSLPKKDPKVSHPHTLQQPDNLADTLENFTNIDAYLAKGNFPSELEDVFKDIVSLRESYPKHMNPSQREDFILQGRILTKLNGLRREEKNRAVLWVFYWLLERRWENDIPPYFKTSE